MVISVLVLICFTVIYLVYRHRAEITVSWWNLLVLKIVAGLGYVLLYKLYYQEGDLFFYQDLANQFIDNKAGYSLFNLFSNDPVFLIQNQQPRTLLFAKIFTFVYVLCGQNIYLSSIVFSIFSASLLFLAFRVFPNGWNKTAWGYALFLPSIVFWGSGINKDTLSFPFFLVVFFLIINWVDRGIGVRGLLLLGVSAVVLFKLRFFYLPLLTVFGFVYAAGKYWDKSIFWILAGLIVGVYLVGNRYLIPQLQPKYFLEILHISYRKMQMNSVPGSSMVLNFQENDGWSTLVAMIVSLKGMFFLRFDGFLTYFASFENLLVFTCVVSSLIISRKTLSYQYFTILIFVLVSALIINVTTPNFGSLIRYRVFYWFVLVGASLELLVVHIDKLPAKKILNSFRFR